MTSTDTRAAVPMTAQATDADNPVLISKVTVPSLPAWAVRRPHIDKLVAEAVRGTLTTVTGPPGGGKTIAIALWAAANSDPGTLAWVTLDEYDNQPKGFWSCVVAALRRTGIAVPRALPTAVRGTADHVFLLQLASALAAQDPPVVLVLDDFHLVTERDTIDGLAYVLRNAAPGLHLVVSSRMDPLPPLHRYRLTGELTEIRADDLAFSLPESTVVVAQHGITLSPEGLERIVARTEGWPAGVRLAALSMQGHPDPELFAKEFDAEDSAVTGYLMDEILNAQPASIRDFLLRTSILNRVSEDVAHELDGDEQAMGVLPDLARANAFVRPVGHGWYRYHSMFAAVLSLKLRQEHPDLVPELHRRAARWYQRSGLLTEAVRHAADSGDWAFAARIALDELAIGQLIEPRGSRSLAARFRGMPEEPAWTQPQPLLVEAAIELSDADGVPGAAALDAAECVLEQLPAGEEMPTRLAAAQVRLAVSRRIGQLDAARAAVADAEGLLAEIPGSLIARHPVINAQVRCGRGVVELWSGDLDRATAALTSALAAASAPGGTYERAECLGYLALVAALSGRLSRAAELAGQAVGAAETDGDGFAEFPSPAATAALAYVHMERNELRQAHAQLRLANSALRIVPDRLISAISCLLVARCQLAEGGARAASGMVGQARHGWSPPRWLEHRLELTQMTAGRLPAGQSDPDQAAPIVVERLSKREHEVLQLLAEMLSTAEIAAEMYISVNTVKTHLRSIYRKLSADHRGEAVRRARRLELI